MIKIEQSWKELMASLQRSSGRTSTIIVGPSDSGKSTLCRFLGKALAHEYRTARIDCDPGQSVIGPPACLGLGWEPWEEGTPVSLRFVGSKTPVRHFMQMLTGAKRLSERAKQVDVEHLLFDPPGYIDTDAGREFLFQMIDLINPDRLVALQHKTELDPLLAPFERRITPTIHRLPVSDAVVKRDPPKRVSYRKARFANYFADAAEHQIDATDLGFHGRVSRFDRPEQYTNQLVALCDRSGFAVSIGILEAIVRENQILTVYCPPFDPDEIASLHFGALYIDRTGEEI